MMNVPDRQITPDERPAPEVERCECCGEPIGKYAFYLDGRRACTKCFWNDVMDSFGALETADALGYQWTVAEGAL